MKSCGYGTNDSKENEKEHKEEAKAVESMEVEEESPVPIVTNVKIFLHSLFSNFELYVNNWQIYNSNGLYAQKSYFSNNSKGAISEYKGVLHSEGYDWEECLVEVMDAPLSEPFFTSRMNRWLYVVW